MAILAKGTFILGKTVKIREANTKLSSPITEVEAGTEVVIARAGTPVVKPVRARKWKKAKPARRNLFGSMKGKILAGPDFDDPLTDGILETFRGRSKEQESAEPCPK